MTLAKVLDLLSYVKTLWACSLALIAGFSSYSLDLLGMEGPALKENNVLEVRYIEFGKLGLLTLRFQTELRLGGGEVASSLAIKTLAELAPILESEGIDNDSIEDLLLNTLQEIDSEIGRVAALNEDLTGMGTTLSALMMYGRKSDKKVALLHVGDSRCYRLRGNTLTQISHDHTVLQELLYFYSAQECWKRASMSPPLVIQLFSMEKPELESNSLRYTQHKILKNAYRQFGSVHFTGVYGGGRGVGHAM